jgi:hypothetical protein
MSHIRGIDPPRWHWIRFKQAAPGLKQSKSSVDKALGSSTSLQSTKIETLFDFSKMPRLGTVRLFQHSLAAVRSPMRRSSETSRDADCPQKGIAAGAN